MRRTTLLFLVAFLLMTLPLTHAQEEATAPDYVRFCERDNDQALIDTLNASTPQLDEINNALAPFDTGNLTYLEGIGIAEGFIATWETAVLPDCLLPLKKEVDDTLNNLLLAMLYGQVENAAKSTEHLEKFKALQGEIRTNVALAVEYLNTPVAAAETPADETTPADPNALRSSEALNPELQDFLLNNGVSVLENAGIQVFPGNTLILIQLNRFSPEYDLPNVIYTLDVLSDLIADWPETSHVVNIVVETYDGTERVQVVTASGDAFRNYYYNGTLTQADFEAQLTVQ